MQKPEDEILSRKVLFDAVLLVDYPFLYLNAKYIKSLTLTRLIVIHEAVEYFRYDELIIVFGMSSSVIVLTESNFKLCHKCRGLGDQNRAVSYIKAFSASRLPLQIIKWVTRQNGLEEKSGRANGSSLKALISK